MISINEPDAMQRAPDFSDPLGLIKACHTRILYHCDLLEKISAHIAENGMDEEAANAARRVYRYFNIAGKLHHQDEEQDIFPRLVRASMKIADTINSLKQDHKQLDALWDTFGPSLENPYQMDLETLPEFTKACSEFNSEMQNHLQIEEDLFSIAEPILSSDDLKAIGKEMHKRHR